MDSRLKASLKIDLKTNLKIIGYVILVLVSLNLIIPGGFSLAIGHGLGWSKEDFASIPGSISIAIVVFTWLNFDFSFKSKMQNGFSRTQLFKNDVLLIALLSVVIAFLNRVFKFSLVGNSNSTYDGFFSIGFLNVLAIFVISILGNYFFISIGEFLGAFFSLFSKRIRKWIMVVFFVGWVFGSFSLFTITAIGIGTFADKFGVDTNTVVTTIFNVLFGYHIHGPYNPINFVITLLVLDGMLTLVNRFIIHHLQLHRN
ncbi:hypothetical protein [Lactobacillus sp. Sy-1]|uniref:hypothetical protein n=1 Tax=Lactobacillus sp. Sy-1 TaxID=2109645 RepID=UPI001C578D65|nr:hypothetical protein [Lactobacillus sp. Sy-1]MBW1605823.1 hypothetical protein [Lactobacillus sp. Sy-1]